MYLATSTSLFPYSFPSTFLYIGTKSHKNPHYANFCVTFYGVIPPYLFISASEGMIQFYHRLYLLVSVINGRQLRLKMVQTVSQKHSEDSIGSELELFRYSQKFAHPFNASFLLVDVWMDIEIKCCCNIGMTKYHTHCFVITLAFNTSGSKCMAQSMKYNWRYIKTL